MAYSFYEINIGNMNNNWTSNVRIQREGFCSIYRRLI